MLTASDERQADVYRSLLETAAPADCCRSAHDSPSWPIPTAGASVQAEPRCAPWIGARPLSAGRHCRSVKRRVLIIHSGGDSRRLPHCSATGKLLARLPRQLPDGRALDRFR